MTGKLNKQESRLQRKIDKLAKNKEKNARLSTSIDIQPKYIRSTATPSLEKIPRSNPPDNYKTDYFAWCDTKADTIGSWKWAEDRQWSNDEYATIIKRHLDSHHNSCWNDVETMTYNGVHGVRKLLNKYQPIDSLCSIAQKRWLELDDLSQFDELFRFRLGTDRRIWGIRIDHHFFMVWYERHHKICPIKD